MPACPISLFPGPNTAYNCPSLPYPAHDPAGLSKPLQNKPLIRARPLPGAPTSGRASRKTTSLYTIDLSRTDSSTQLLVLFAVLQGGFGECLFVVWSVIGGVFGGWLVWLVYLFYGRYDGVLARARARARVYPSCMALSLSLGTLWVIGYVTVCQVILCLALSGGHLALSVGTLCGGKIAREFHQ